MTVANLVRTWHLGPPRYPKGSVGVDLLQERQGWMWFAAEGRLLDLTRSFYLVSTVTGQEVEHCHIPF